MSQPVSSQSHSPSFVYLPPRPPSSTRYAPSYILHFTRLVRRTEGGYDRRTEERDEWGKEVTRLSEGTEEMSERRSLPWPGSAGRDGEGP